MIIYSPKPVLTKATIIVFTLIVVFSLTGCGEFFSEKATELQSQAILREISQIKENPNVRNPLPELYRSPPSKVVVHNGVKVFYFTKNLTVEKLTSLVKEQLKLEVSQSPAVNQLIIHCPSQQSADSLLEFLEKVDVEPIQVNIDCLILERFADKTADWETTLLMENLFGEGVTLGGKTDSSGNLLPNFPGASLRESKRSDFGLNVGYWRNQEVLGHQFRAMVDVLISQGYLKILMNPVIETVNGEKARIVSRENVPLEKILLKEGFDEPFSLTEYQWVEDILDVNAYVYADGSIGLSTKIQIGSTSKPEGVVQASVITERTIEVSENRIKPGESLVIGGIKKSEERAVIRGVPFFKDLPLVGILFSSKDFEESANEVIFILTPSISSGSVEHAQMINQVRQKHAPPEYSRDLHTAITDPFGATAYTSYVERQAEKEQAKAIKSVKEAQEKTKKAKAEAELAKLGFQKAEEKVATIEKQAQLETEKARLEAEKAKAQTAEAHAEIEKLKIEAQKAKSQADKAKIKAQKAEKEAERAKTEAQKAKEEAEKAKKEAEKAKKEAENAKKQDQQKPSSP